MLNKYSAIPLYYQLAGTIAGKIDSGELAMNSKLPSERELCDIYGVSRTTVRQAIQELQRLGCVVCLHGKGNYVIRSIIRQQLLTIYSFSDEMKKLGKVPSTRLVSYQRILCDANLAAEMEVEIATPLYRFERVRLADNEPVMFVTTYLLQSRFAGFDCEKLSDTSLYKILREEYSLTLTEVHENMQAVSIRRNEAHHLHTSVNTPAMMISRKSYESRQIVEYAVGIARGDKFRYDVVLKNKQEGN